MGHGGPLPQQTGPMTASWVVSCLLHVMLAIAAFAFVRNLQLVPQSETFQWDVAVVASPFSSAHSAPATQSASSPPTAIQPPAPSAASGSPARRSVAPARTEPPPLATSEPPPNVSQDRFLQSELTGSRTTPTLSTDSPPTVTPQPLSTPTLEEAILPHNEPPIGTDSPPAPSSPTVAAVSPADQVHTGKTDYGWLAALMAQWIENLDKRYPALLRTEGVQGKVTLAAVLHEDGTLSNVRIVKSSGYATLDQVAVEDVQNGPSINLVRPLDRTQMPVKFSIRYDLKRAR